MTKQAQSQSSSLPGKPSVGQAFERLADITARLRAPDGCPWDREQTHLSLRKHLVEETYETLDAIENEDMAHLREELGDLLMQPVLHAQIAREAGHFDIVEVLEEISDKLVRRHPHVFGDVNVENSEAVLQNWDAIKKQEKAARTENQNGQNFESILCGVPKSLPALALAQEVSKKAAKAGFEWPDAPGVLEKLHEEIEELKSEVQSGSRERIAEELGDVLFTLVNVARWHKIDAELALRDTVKRFSARFEHMEKAAQQNNRVLEELSSQEWDDLWNSAKRESDNV